MKHLHRDAMRVLTTWNHADPAQLAMRDAYVEYLKVNPDAAGCHCHPAHLTASALVVNPAHDAVLLTLHPKVGRWLQLGGHLEVDDESLRDAVAREVWEESGYRPRALSRQPLRLDRHPVPCGGEQREHLDVQYLVVVDDRAAPQRSDESLDLAWFSLEALPGDLDASVQMLIGDARSEGGRRVTDA
jgi:8-oxo-dGTP pyrophosphatase MutT (NUDIX family)